MRKILRRMPSPAMVVACIALAVALGGTSYAAIKLPSNSVGTRQLQANSISAPKLQERSVGPNKLQARAVSDRVVKSNSLTGASINEATLGPVPLAIDATKLGGNTVRRLVAGVAPGGAEATVLNLNGLVITLTCPAGAVMLRANNNSGSAAQLRFEGFGAASFGGGSASLISTSNVDLNNSENRGSGSAHFFRADGTFVTALYGWREDALGGTAACRVFGVAISA
jgi:hypothetical protein